MSEDSFRWECEDVHRALPTKQQAASKTNPGMIAFRTNTALPSARIGRWKVESAKCNTGGKISDVSPKTDMTALQMSRQAESHQFAACHKIMYSKWLIRVSGCGCPQIVSAGSAQNQSAGASE